MSLSSRGVTAALVEVSEMLKKILRLLHEEDPDGLARQKHA